MAIKADTTQIDMSKSSEEETSDTVEIELDKSSSEETSDTNQEDQKATESVSLAFKLYVIVSMTFIWTGYTLLVRYTRSTTKPEYLYSATTVVFLAECTKMLITVWFLFYESSFSIREFSSVVRQEFLLKPIEMLKMSVPSIVYAFQNNLVFIALSNLDAGVYQMTIQLKVVTTAIFMMLFLGRRFSLKRWIAIALLVVGVALFQLNSIGKKPIVASTYRNNENYFVGITAVLCICITAGFAGVYTEKMLKDESNTPFWIRNLQMYLWGMIFAFSGCFISDLETILDKGFFHGYSILVVLIIGFLSCGGIYVSLVMKYLDNLHKSFASAVSIIAVTILSIFIFEAVTIEIFFVLGTAIVCFAIILYNSSTPSTMALSRTFGFHMNSNSLVKNYIFEI